MPSIEEARQIVTRLYQEVFGRAPDPVGLNTWAREVLVRGEAVVRTMLEKTEEGMIFRIKRDYGFLAAFLDIPDVRQVLFRAEQEDWDAARLQGAVFATPWWQTHADAERKWVALKSLDPAEAGRQIQARLAEVSEASRKLGIPIPADRAASIAEQSLQFGWSTTEIHNAVTAEFDYVQGQVIPAQQGAIAVTFDAMKTAASQWGVDIDEPTIETWLEQVIKQQTTMDNFSVYLKEMSKSRWPALNSLIDEGHSPQQIFAPYAQTAARLLGLNPASITFNDPKWARSMGYVDPKSGDMRMMDIYEWERTIKQDPVYGWKHTQGAIDEGTEFALNLGKIMGKVPA